MVVKTAAPAGTGLKRFKAARDKGSEYLRSIQREDGSFPGVERGAGAYWGIPIALYVGGHSAGANRLFRWIRKNAFTAEGDIGPSPAEATFHHYAYEKSWLIEGAHRLAQFDLSQKGTDFMLRMWDEESGGFFSSATERSADTKMDLWINSGSARALLYTGRLDVARATARWMKNLMDLQPNYPEQLYPVWSKAKGLITEPEMDDRSRDYRFPADWRYVLNQKAERDQTFFNPGIAGGFLARLYQSTGETEWLDLAKRYMLLAEGASDFQFRTLRAGKTGWGASALYTITGEDKYGEMATRIGDNIIAMQDDQGFWSGAIETSDTPSINLGAEMVVWLDEIHQAVGEE